jgi:hypothetical protein
MVGAAVADEVPAQQWRTDYAEAYKEARADHKYLLIWFTNDKPTEADELLAARFREESLAQPLAQYVAVAIPTTAISAVAGKEVRLLDDPSFVEMLKLPGLAILDVRDKESKLYGALVSVYPFRTKQRPDKARLQTLLDLPTGTLTQRTMIFAVRTHGEHPRSTQGTLDGMLASEAAKHSQHQASITLQGHHNWDQRFHAINARLPGGLLAQEVCAESWPGQRLVEAAEECVHSWRQSSGHWSAVSGNADRYAYDMHRGRNGVWYATGIFGKRQ